MKLRTIVLGSVAGAFCWAAAIVGANAVMDALVSQCWWPGMAGACAEDRR